MWVFVVVKNLHGAKAWTPDILSTGMFFNQIDLSKLVRSTRFYVDFSSLNISQPDHVCWCGWISKQIIDHALKSVEIAPQFLCPARRMSPAMWICSQHKKILSTDMWMFSEHCSPECGSYEAPGAEFWLVWLVKRHHPWSSLSPMGRPPSSSRWWWSSLESTNLVRIMWISGDLCVCACTCVCTTTLSLAVIWIVQNGSKFDPYRPPGFQQPSLLQHMLVHNIESAFLNIFKLAS